MAPKGDMQITMVRPAQLTDVSIGRCDKRFLQPPNRFTKSGWNFPLPRHFAAGGNAFSQIFSMSDRYCVVMHIPLQTEHSRRVN